MQYIHLYLDNAATKSNYHLIENVKAGISERHVNQKIRTTQLSKFHKMRTNFMDAADYLTSDTKKEFEQFLRTIVESAYTSTHTSEGKLDLQAVQIMINRNKKDLAQLRMANVKIEEIINIINNLRSQEVTYNLLKYKLQYSTETGKIIDIKVPDGGYSEVNQEIINSVIQKIQQIESIARTIQQNIPRAYEKLTSFNPQSGDGTLTIREIFKSFQGYESAYRGLLYELSIYLGYVDAEHDGIDAFLTGRIDKEIADKIKKDSKMIQNKELCERIQQDVKSFINGYKSGYGKSDLTFHVFDKNGSFSAIEMVSIKDSTFSALHPEYGKISLGGSAKPFYQLLDNNFLSELLNGQDPRYYALQTFTGVAGSTVKKIPRPRSKKITADMANKSFRSLIDAAGILNFIDYLVGSGKYGDTATYFAVNGKLYDIASVLKNALQDINAISFTVPASLKRNDKRAIELQTEAFSDTDKDGSDRSDYLISRFESIFSGMLQAKLKISLLAGLAK